MSEREDESFECGEFDGFLCGGGCSVFFDGRVEFDGDSSDWSKYKFVTTVILDL